MKPNIWDQRYGEPGFAYGTEPNEFLAENAERYLPRNGEVVSLAEGEGRNAVFLARRGFRVTGVDSSAVGLDKARALAARSGVSIETIVADLATFDLGRERWDAVVAIWCHVPPQVRARLYRSAAEALRTGGVVLLESYTPKQLEYRTGGPPTAELLMTLDEAKDVFAGLDVLVGEEKVRDVHEGKFHEGKSAVLQVIARKR